MSTVDGTIGGVPYADPDRQREYQRIWRAHRRAEWFEGKVCVDCGGSRNLEVDHVDASRKVSHRIWSWTAKRRNAELAKCVVRCKPCHRQKAVACDEVAYGESVHGAHSATLVLARSRVQERDRCAVPRDGAQIRTSRYDGVGHVQPELEASKVGLPQ